MPLAQDKNGAVYQLPHPTFGKGSIATVTATAGLAGPFASTTVGLILTSTIAMFYELGDSDVVVTTPVGSPPTSGGHYLAANIPVQVSLGGHQRSLYMSVIRGGASDGTLYITEFD